MKARGQATVELALGGLVVVTILLLGLYLTEISFLSLKVQEASAAAIWEATGRPTHDFRNPSSPAAVRAGYADMLTGPQSVPEKLTRLYADYDGIAEGGNGTARVFTRGEPIQVRCERSGAGPGADPIAFNIPAASGSASTRINDQLREWYQNRGGTLCTASARALPFGLPNSFADRTSSGGFFADFQQGPEAIRLCGTGRAVSGECPTGYGVLLGDWGLDGPPGSQIVRDAILIESEGVDPDTVNQPYRRMVRDLFRESGRSYDADGSSYGEASKFAMRIAGQFAGGKSPHNEKNFYMSFAGVEHDYSDMLEPRDAIPADCRSCHFNTAGTQIANGNPRPEPEFDWRYLRKPCFLGIGGCTVER